MRHRLPNLFYLLMVVYVSSSSSKPPAWMFDIKEAVKTIEGNQSTINLSKQPYRQVCYPELGCFTNDGPFAHTGLLPQSPEMLQTAFYTFTTAQHEDPLIFWPNSDVRTLLRQLTGNGKRDGQSEKRKILAVIVHGYGMSYKSYGFFDLKDALLQHSGGEVAAVISLQWKEGARTGSSTKFAQACTNVQLVGAQLGHFLSQIRSLEQESSISLYCIGYSLGAHVCSFAGRFTQSYANFSLDRITGLDPNWALFEDHQRTHLRASDAHFVDVLHTSAGRRLMTGEHGISGALGHADFYLNGGSHQPQCDGVDASNLVCDHFSSVLYYIAALTANWECTFIGYPLEEGGKSPKVMGFWADKDEDKDDGEESFRSIKYYLNTTDHYPYCSD